MSEPVWNENMEEVRDVTGLQGGELAKALLITLTCAAAKSDGNEVQRKALAKGYLVYAEHYDKTGDGRPLIEFVRSVMGMDWVPRGRYAEQINRLLPNGRGFASGGSS